MNSGAWRALSGGVERGCREVSQFDWRELAETGSFGLWPAPVRGLLLCAVFVLLSGLGYVLHLSPRQEEAARLARDRMTGQDELASRRAAVREFEEERAHLAEQERRFAGQLSRLPRESELPGLLEAVAEGAAVYGLDLGALELLPEEAKDHYSALPIELAVTGRFHDMAGFLARLASLPPLISVERLILERDGESARVEGVLTLSTYHYAGEDAVQEGAGEADAAVAQRPYRAGEGRDPFLFRREEAGLAGGDPVPPPDPERERGELEAHGLDDLRLVGTLTLGERRWGLIRTPAGGLVQVTTGDYLGRHHGRVASLDRGVLHLRERVRDDGTGRWRARRRSLALE